MTTGEPRVPVPAEVLQARQALGLTQAEAAALLGVDRVTWARYEAGGRAMSAVEWKYFKHVAGVERIPFRAAVAG